MYIHLLFTWFSFLILCAHNCGNKCAKNKVHSFKPRRFNPSLFSVGRKKRGANQIALFLICHVQGFSITVIVKISILVTFACSTLTHTSALPVVFWVSVTIAVVAFMVTVPSASTVVLMIGLTVVML